MSGIPEDIRQKARNILDAACLPIKFYENGTLRMMEADIVTALLAERQRCANTVDAEIEWGGSMRDAEQTIRDGTGPRIIPGYNDDLRTPSEREAVRKALKEGGEL